MDFLVDGDRRYLPFKTGFFLQGRKQPQPQAPRPLILAKAAVDEKRNRRDRTVEPRELRQIHHKYSMRKTLLVCIC
jgi:hypothetical protein